MPHQVEPHVLGLLTADLSRTAAERSFHLRAIREQRQNARPARSRRSLSRAASAPTTAIDAT